MSAMSAARVLPDIKQLAQAGFNELVQGACNWRVWHLLGTKELRNRYMRSKLGQLWLTLSSAIMIGVMGLVWSLLFKQPVRDLLPFFGISLIMWNFMSQVLIECTGVFNAHGQFYRNQKMNFAVSVYSVIYKNTIIIGYNLIIIAILIIGFPNSGELVSFADHSGFPVDLDHVGMVGLRPCHGVRALSRSNSSYFQLDAAAFLLNPNHVEA